MAIPNFTWERPHCRPSLYWELAAGSFISCKPSQCWGFPLTQPGRYQATKMQCLPQWLGWHVSICTPALSTGSKIKLVRSQTWLWLGSPVFSSTGAVYTATARTEVDRAHSCTNEPAAPAGLVSHAAETVQPSSSFAAACPHQMGGQFLPAEAKLAPGEHKRLSRPDTAPL